MKTAFKIFTALLLVPTMCLVFIMGGISLMEGYNIFEPYIDTEFSENYTPEKFDQISLLDSKTTVLQAIGQPLDIHEDTQTKEIQFAYTNDGNLKRKSPIKHDIADFAWYRSIIIFDSTGKIIRIEKGWSYD